MLVSRFVWVDWVLRSRLGCWGCVAIQRGPSDRHHTLEVGWRAAWMTRETPDPRRLVQHQSDRFQAVSWKSRAVCM